MKVSIVLRYIVLLCLLLNSERAVAASLRITGKVTDPAGEPLASAAVMLSGSGGNLLPSAKPVDILGNFDILLPDWSGAYVHCLVSAPGYAPSQKNMLITGNQAQIGEIRLAALSPLEITSLTIAPTSDGKYFLLDAFVRAQAKRAARVQEIQIEGTSRKATACLEYAPALTATVSDTIRVEGGEERTAVTVRSTAEAAADAISATVQLELLPCRQVRLRLTAPLSVKLATEEKKLRVVLHKVMRVKSEKSGSTDLISIDQWEHLVLRLHLSDGTRTEAIYNSSGDPVRNYLAH